MFSLPNGLNKFMKKQLLALLILLLFTSSVSAQTKEARKIAELGKVQCGFFNALMDGIHETYKKLPDSKIYVIYYEELNYLAFVNGSNEATLVKPRRGNALNRAKEVSLFLTTEYKLPKNKIILIDGGFKKDFELEVWLVPKDAKLPKPSPTVDEKDVKFREGKPVRTRNCARAYDGYK
jgi:hypothetical protein